MAGARSWALAEPKNRGPQARTARRRSRFGCLLYPPTTHCLPRVAGKLLGNRFWTVKAVWDLPKQDSGKFWEIQLVRNHMDLYVKICKSNIFWPNVAGARSWALAEPKNRSPQARTARRRSRFGCLPYAPATHCLPRASRTSPSVCQMTQASLARTKCQSYPPPTPCDRRGQPSINDASVIPTSHPWQPFFGTNLIVACAWKHMVGCGEWHRSALHKRWINRITTSRPSGPAQH